MIRRPPRSTQSRSSAASDVYKRQDNVLIEMNGPEAPILDGSAGPYVKILNEAGIVAQHADVEYFEIKRKIVYRNVETGTEIIAYPDDDFSIDVMISYNSVVLDNQYATYNSQTKFAEEIAPCRTCLL